MEPAILSSPVEAVSTTVRALKSGLSCPSVARYIGELARHWEERVGTILDEAVLDNEVFHFHSQVPVRFRSTDRMPVIFLGERCSLLQSEVSLAIQRSVSFRQLPIFVCLTDSAFQFMRTSRAIPVGRCVILARDEFVSLFRGADPLRRLVQHFRAQIPLSRLVPFCTSDPAEGQMFVGRSHELELLMHSDQDFALCGPGGMGKSSLLRQMQWLLRRDRDPRSKRIVEVDLISCEPNLDAAARAIAMRVSPTKYAHDLTLQDLEAFFRRVKATDLRFSDGPIDLVIDEVDAILSLDRRTHFAPGVSIGAFGTEKTKPLFCPLLRELKHARMNGLIRLTIAGRTETKRLLDDPENPFVVDCRRIDGSASRIRLLPLGPLQPAEANDLLFTALEDLGCATNSTKAEIEKLLQDCHGIPFAIQNLGFELANSVSRNCNSH